jgi:uncharacterized membrane protein YeiH
VGVCVVAFLAAFGGGTLRDLLLDQRPFFWVRHTELVWGILAAVRGAMLFMRQRHFQPTERAMLLPDALGLGLFTAVGVDRAMAVGMPALVAVMMGVMTGVFGGVLRDMLCNEVPQAFSDHRPMRCAPLPAAQCPAPRQCTWCTARSGRRWRAGG